MPDDVRVWRIELDVTAPLSARVLALLDAAERARLERYRRHEDRVRFAVARTALKRLLAACAAPALPPSSVTLSCTPQGRPVWPESGLAFSVAHSARLALIAISPCHEVGVDVERHRDVDIDALADLVLAPAERRALDALPAGARGAGLHRYWTCKEAALKAAGRGIVDGPRRVEVRAHAACADTWSIQCDDAMPGRDRLRSLTLHVLPLPPAYSGALAWGPRR